MDAVFSVDLEDFFHALTPPVQWERWRRRERIVPMTYTILTLLRQAEVTAIFYVLGDVAFHHPRLVRHIREAGHRVGSHGYWHRHGERIGDESDWQARLTIGGEIFGYRSPYWDSTPRPGWCTGAFLRWLPYPLLLTEVRRSHVLSLHPHDLDEEQPRLPWAPWWRYGGVARAKASVLRLLQTVSWERQDV